MKELKTHWKKLQNPNYLGAWTLQPDRDLILTIDRVVKEEIIGSGGSKEERPVMYFKEGVKPMILNTTNSKTIQKIAGTPFVEDWKDFKIQLYVAQVSAFGDMVEALRIRSNVTLLTEEETRVIDFVKKAKSTDDLQILWESIEDRTKAITAAFTKRKKELK